MLLVSTIKKKNEKEFEKVELHVIFQTVSEHI